MTQVFDAAGNLSTRTDARGITTSHTYDTLNRLTGVSYSGTNTSRNVAYTWDANPGGALVCTNGVGRLCRQSGAGSTRHFAYDPFGNLIQARQIEDELTTTQGFGYDGEDRLSAVTTAAGKALAVTRDDEGRPDQVRALLDGSPSTLVAGTTYQATGTPDRTEMANRKVFDRDFDASGFITTSSTETAQAPAEGEVPLPGV